ncbi:TPA: hypothetical protein DIC20_04355 [Candidatus Dependentiae bacterium]|nr:MAG: hypothetical protein US03_C0004G0030 [candidate division TM6 bacterium GW2011_GWF2_36_131]KKQ03208.1 MAG: hypothetical protein US13_C0004G0030 [candidate division TM6 bacterium GW2011_GWE2_36_25]KKQ19006.1 MAG: hypothetical protein US32_C0018G0012 [candidate division TM6 bacterium GW2011_GWA2_36_9]HBR70362.1 hypothetical protein [Candidatus Dependentiae bacterium]HCU00907.1 hypothetical protein [Candidatus Dependentiae bacterium]
MRSIYLNIFLLIFCIDAREFTLAEQLSEAEKKVLEDKIAVSQNGMLFSSLEVLNLGDQNDPNGFYKFWDQLYQDAQSKKLKKSDPRKDALKSLAIIATNLNELARLWSGALYGVGILTQKDVETLLQTINAYDAQLESLTTSTLGDQKFKEKLQKKLDHIKARFPKKVDAGWNKLKNIGASFGQAFVRVGRGLLCID